MAESEKILITGELIPGAMNGCITSSKYIRGGYIVVQTLVERDALLNSTIYEDIDVITNGTPVYVVEDTSTYRYSSTTGTFVDDSYYNKNQTYSQAEINTLLNNKENTLAFEGVYDAATNKVATASFVTETVADKKTFKAQILSDGVLPTPGVDTITDMYLIDESTTATPSYAAYVTVGIVNNLNTTYEWVKIGGGSSEGSGVTDKGTYDSSVTYNTGDIVKYTFTVNTQSYTFKYLSIIENNVGHTPSTNLSNLDNSYWISLNADASTASKSVSVLIKQSDDADNLEHALLLSDATPDSYGTVIESYNSTTGKSKIYAKGGQLYDNRGLLAAATDIPTIENTITANSPNGITSGAVYAGLNTFKDAQGVVITSEEADGTSLVYNYNSVNYTAEVIADSSYSSLTSIKIPKYTRNASDNCWYKVTGIANQAFYQCVNLVAINLPNTLVSIGDSAFEGCTGLLNVLLPATVTTISNNAFTSCSSLGSVSIIREDDSIISGAPWGAPTTAEIVYYRPVKDSQINTWNNKQNALIFDTTPTSGSTNPVTSGGVYNHTKYITICDTAGNANRKVVQIPDYTPASGQCISVYMVNANTYTSGDLILEINNYYSYPLNLMGSELTAGWHNFYFDNGSFVCGSYIPAHTKSFIPFPVTASVGNGKFVFNTAMSIDVVDSILSNVPLTIATGQTGQDEIGEVLVDNSITNGTYGLYVVDLSKFGGTGYALATVSSNTAAEDPSEAFVVHHIVYISDISGTNLAIASNFIQGFNPSAAGWQDSSYAFYNDNVYTFITGIMPPKIGVGAIIGLDSGLFTSDDSQIEELWHIIDKIVDEKMASIT